MRGAVSCQARCVRLLCAALHAARHAQGCNACLVQAWPQLDCFTAMLRSALRLPRAQCPLHLAASARLRRARPARPAPRLPPQPPRPYPRQSRRRRPRRRPLRADGVACCPALCARVGSRSARCSSRWISQRGVAALLPQRRRGSGRWKEAIIVCLPILCSYQVLSWSRVLSLDCSSPCFRAQGRAFCFITAGARSSRPWSVCITLMHAASSAAMLGEGTVGLSAESAG